MILPTKKELQAMWVSHVDGSLRMVWCDEAPEGLAAKGSFVAACIGVRDACHAG
jgi:hypothetical protein